MIFLKCKIRFIYICRIQLQKKKGGVKKFLETMSIEGEGVGRLVEKSVLNFHFGNWNPSLGKNA